MLRSPFLGVALVGVRQDYLIPSLRNGTHHDLKNETPPLISSFPSELGSTHPLTAGKCLLSEGV